MAFIFFLLLLSCFRCHFHDKLLIETTYNTKEFYLRDISGFVLEKDEIEIIPLIKTKVSQKVPSNVNMIIPYTQEVMDNLPKTTRSYMFVVCTKGIQPDRSKGYFYYDYPSFNDFYTQVLFSKTTTLQCNSLKRLSKGRSN